MAATAPVTLGNYVTAKAPSRKDESLNAYVAITNWLLDAHWTAVELKEAEDKAKRLADRMDAMSEQFPPGTAERGEAETVRSGLVFRVGRFRNHVKDRARRVSKHWEELGEWETVLMLDILPGWKESPIWEVVTADAVLCKDRRWQAMREAATAERSEEPCPF